MNNYNYTDEQILAAAKAAHECNRAFCVAIGDNSQVTWEWAEQWQRDASLTLVKDIANGVPKTPRERHDQWCQDKYTNNWKFGPVKDSNAKTHPCLVAYENLPVFQQKKDEVVECVVNAVLASFIDVEENLPGA